MTTATWMIAPPPIPESEIVQVYNADVIVVGTGYAGTAAFRAAAEAGASVIAIEKQRRDKYIAIGQDIGHINSRFLAGRGVPRVDPIEFFNEWMKRSDNRANPRLIIQYAKKSGENVDWFLQPAKKEELDQIIINYWPPVEKFDGVLAGYKFWFGTAVLPGWRQKGTYSCTDLPRKPRPYL